MKESQLSKELVAASTVPIILSILQKGESYGYEIIKEVKALSDNQLDWKEGSLYPVLSKLEKKGLINGLWKISENGRKRKYYSLNQNGKKQLKLEIENWKIINQTLIKLWGQENLILKSL